MTPLPTLNRAQARRVALEAQLLARDRPASAVTARQVGRVLDRIQLLQIDSVNVLARSHYLPLYARLGPYDRAIADRLAARRPRRMIEYWAHEASFVRPDLFEYLRPWQHRPWAGAASLPTAVREDLSARILQLLESSRPLTAAQVQQRLGHSAERATEQWGWNWHPAKRVLEHLFQDGLVSSAGRTGQFERLYAPAVRVLPEPAQALRRIDPEEALLVLTERAARALGVGTVRCLADYFRVPARATAQAAEKLVRRGALRPVWLAGWDQPGYRHPEAVLPRRAAARTLLSPFDSLVFERRRLQALFGFHYRIEIYTPAAARRFGYYVLPFLLGDTMAARVDLKADREGRRLLVRAAHAEPDAPAETALALAAELQTMAGWLGLTDVVVESRGDLAGALQRRI
jgi:uncharacterized protein YcaQ